MQQPLKFEDVNNKMGQVMRGTVNVVVGIFGGPVLFRLRRRIFVEMMVCLQYEAVTFWSIHAMVFHYSIFISC